MRGLLVPVTVTESCSADCCACAECGEFPQTCYRYAAEVVAALAATKEARTDCYGAELSPISESDGTIYAAATKEPRTDCYGAELSPISETWHATLAVRGEP